LKKLKDITKRKNNFTYFCKYDIVSLYHKGGINMKKTFMDYLERPVVEGASISHLRRMAGLADQNHLKSMMIAAKKVSKFVGR